MTTMLEVLRYGGSHWGFSALGGLTGLYVVWILVRTAYGSGARDEPPQR
ncbi:hypothetical protein P7A99_22895 [Caulobacter endophyticus]|nr:hypothetical protein [Caulobacter endophyticus]